MKFLGKLPLLAAALALACATSACAGTPATTAKPAPDIPFPDALDTAAIAVDRVTNLNRQALPVGNGDLNALVYESGGVVRMRVAKNDIWDARMDTSGDGPMMKVNLGKGAWTGGGMPRSWQHPYPLPHIAGAVRLGDGPVAKWACVRNPGTPCAFAGTGKSEGTMTLSGAVDASAGFSSAVPTGTPGCGELRLTLSGTPGARYYVTLRTGAGVVESGWKDSPEKPTEFSFKAAPGAAIQAVTIYIRTAAGKPVENRFAALALVDKDGKSHPFPVGAGTDKAMAGKLDIRRAFATVGDRTTVRALAGRNAFLIESDGQVALEEIRATLPAGSATEGKDGGISWLKVKIPGDLDWPGMEYAFAVAENGRKKVLAVATTRDTGGRDVVAAAAKLAQETLAEDTALTIAAHEAEWAKYWSASGVRLGDAEMQDWWYRMVYLMRCQAKPGVIAPGLWTFMPRDVPPWHGDYHHNYNAWQPNWAPFLVNHAEISEPWIRYMNEMLPRLKWIAKEIYGCEGACIGISSFPYEPPHPELCKSRNGRHCAITPYGNTMGMIGMSAQILWYDHLYHPDRAKLEKDIWPVMREAALFFTSFAEKCRKDEAGKAKYGPSYSPEHGGFGIYDCPYDLTYAKYTIKAAIEAANELGRNPALVDRFRKALALLPDHPTAPDAQGKPIVVDWTGCRFRQIGNHNIAVPTMPVFPGDEVTAFSPEAEKELFRNTLRQTRHRGCNATIMMSVAKARLDMKDGFDDLKAYYKPLAQPNGMFYWPVHGYYLTESTGVAGGICEFLLQSVTGTIRVFPCWPKDKDAAFAGLCAEGGFLVSAEQKGGSVVKLEITSTVGGKLRLVDPWTGKIVERDTKPGRKIVFTRENS